MPGMAAGRRLILHAGPPIAWPAMCGPMRGAILGAVLLEGWADTIAAADAPGRRGERSRSSPATTTAPSDRWRASSARRCRSGSSRTRPRGNRAYCNLNEGLGKVLRFGANGREVIDRLALDRQRRSRRRCARPCGQLGRIELKPLMAQALHMGDEVHNRNAAATALLFKRLAPALLDGGRAARATPPRRSSSSPATTTSSSTCRWPPARRCSTPRRRAGELAW